MAGIRWTARRIRRPGVDESEHNDAVALSSSVRRRGRAPGNAAWLTVRALISRGVTSTPYWDSYGSTTAGGR